MISRDKETLVAKKWTDRNTADLVNELTKIAVRYHHMQQLRERIAEVIKPLADELKGCAK